MKINCVRVDISRYLFAGWFTLFLVNANAQELVQYQLSYADSIRTITIYVPSEMSDKTPILFMMDGQNLFDQNRSYSSEWQIDEFMSGLALNQQAMVVGVDHGEAARIDELTHVKHEKYGGGKAIQFEMFLMDTVVPFIREKYHLTTDSPIGIAGSSLGGLFALRLFHKYPEIFHACGALSPSIWFDIEIKKLYQNSTFEDPNRFLFLSMGRKEGSHHVLNLLELGSMMQDSLDPYLQLLLTNGSHNEEQWRSVFPTFYHQWLDVLTMNLARHR
jgi:predicted alpha/beta superfamily hydrolase